MTVGDEHDRRRRGRLQMLLLLAVSAAPIVLGTLAYYVWTPQGRTNYGEVLPPVQVQASGVDLAGQRATLETLRGRWVLLVASTPECREECRRSLLYSRQVRVAQGREQGRVERAWIVLGLAQPDPELAPLHAGALVIRLAHEADSNALSGEVSRAAEIHLVDPLGRLVMRFPGDPDPRRIVKDVQRLLRVNSAEYGRQ